MTSASPPESCDVLIIGSGAAGLSCAVAAETMGLDVVVVEKAACVGGTTAWSGGEIWAPANRWQRSAGIGDSAEDAISYLLAAAGERGRQELIEAYIRHVPEAVDYFAGLGAMNVEPLFEAPDYFDGLPGGGTVGRTLRTVPFDGRALGHDLRLLAPPMAAAQIFGGLSIDREDIVHFRNLLRSPKSMTYVVKLLAVHGWQRAQGLSHGARTTMGRALVARFFHTLCRKGVRVLTNTPAVKLRIDGQRVSGVYVNFCGKVTSITARRGIVLATGGFSHDMVMSTRQLDHVASGQTHFALPPASVAGDGIRMATDVGGVIGNSVAQSAALAAVSVLRRARADEILVPHFGDRAKPGIIAVLSNGSRFANEAANYHDFCVSLIEAKRAARDAKAFLICDHQALRRYGLGRVGPSPARLGPHLRSGYLLQARTLRDLAIKAGISVDQLQKTVCEYNEMSQRGIDTAYGKGATAFERWSGDSDHTPNPCMKALDRPPFYAIEIHPGNLSTFAGLEIDGCARVLSSNGEPITGLHALGADAISVAGGTYPAAGITLGPAITFGYLAARSLAASAATASPAEAKTYGSASTVTVMK